MDTPIIGKERCWQLPRKEGDASVTLILGGNQTSTLVRFVAGTNEVKILRGYLPEQVKVGLRSRGEIK